MIGGGLLGFVGIFEHSEAKDKAVSMAILSRALEQL